MPVHPGITLTSGTSGNPFTVSGTAYASSGYYAAILGQAATDSNVIAWTVSNSVLVTAATGIGIVLQSGGRVDNHITGASTGTITGVVEGIRIFSTAARSGTVHNDGSISATGSAGIGVDLQSGGTVVNGSTSNAAASITGGLTGVTIAGTGATLSNFGYIGNAASATSGFGVILDGGLTNAGTILAHGGGAFGVELASAGDLANSATGLISGGASGVVADAAGNATNAGQILGAGAYGLYLKQGGGVTNSGTAATIAGNFAGLAIAGAAGTLANSGTVAATGSYHAAVNFSHGGSVANLAGGVITGSNGVGIGGGVGAFTNAPLGTIAATGTNSNGFAADLAGIAVNNGTLTGARGIIDHLATYGTTTTAPEVTNTGEVTAIYAAIDIAASTSAAGTFTNAAGGYVRGGTYGAFVSGAGTVSNAGTIFAPGHSYSHRIYGGAGLDFEAANGVITNAASGYIHGYKYGINIHNGSAVTTNFGTLAGKDGFLSYGGTFSNTLINFGTIISSLAPTVANRDAVLFGHGANLLVDEPGAVFIGNVVAGGVAGDGIELASAASAGTIHQLGLYYKGFSLITVDPGASWTADGSDFNVFHNNGALTTIAPSATFNIAAAGTFSNFGSFIGGATLLSGARFNNGSTLSTVIAPSAGLVGTGAAVTIDNSGVIQAGGIGAGVDLRQTGLINNGNGAANQPLIAGTTGVLSETGGATVANFATISGSSTGAMLAPLDVLTNFNSANVLGGSVGISARGASIANAGTISGAVGVSLSGGGEVSGGGTIIGTGGTAVQLGTGSNTLVLASISHLSGIADGSGGTNTLELDATAPGTLAGLGTAFANFSTIAIDTTARWEITGTATAANLLNDGTLATGTGDAVQVAGTLSANGTATGRALIGGTGTLALLGGVAAGETVAFVAGSSGELAIGTASAFAGSVTGFAAGATIDFLHVHGDTAHVSGGMLTVTNAGIVVASLPVAGNFSGAHFTATPAAGDTLVTTDAVACFAAGTRLLGATGEVAVETLRPGDRLVASRGQALRPVRWIGQTRVEATPVRIAASAIAPGVPHRDLLLSPDHAVWLDGALIPVRYLINGVTIVQDVFQRITYYHVELPEHDVILAEGLPCESYLDTGNRAAFADEAAVPA